MMKRAALIGLISLIGLFGFVKSILADELYDFKRDLKTMEQRIQQIERQGEGEVIKMTNGPKLRLTGFSDISFSAEDSGEMDSNTFALGQFDLFITSKLSDNVSFLGEIIFEFDDNEAFLDLERVELKYNLKEWFSIKLGRMHTSMGYWNTAYHHSTWLHTSIYRPLLYNWEDEVGIMPVHIVGIDFFGRKALGPFNINYTLGIGNGRGTDATVIQNIEDDNDAKAYNLLVSVAPDFIQGLTVGFNIYNDTIPANGAAGSPRNGEIDELILSGYFVYYVDKIELLGEISNINHDDDVGDNKYDTLGFYILGSYKIGDLTPFYKFDHIDFGNGDPYYNIPTDIDIDISKHSIGLRWDVNTWHALKLEYNYSDRKQSADDSHTITANASFRF